MVRPLALALCWVAVAGCGQSVRHESAETAAPPVGLACETPAYDPAPPVPCFTACGNGTLDSCDYCSAQIQGPSASLPPCRSSTLRATFTEPCDGAAQDASTCASLGFFGGALGCSAVCSYDTRRCDVCAPDAHTLACRQTEVAAGAPSSLALTVTDEAIVVAWVSGPGMLNASVPGGARLARFADDLSLIDQSSCFGPANAHSLSLARTGSGFLVAIDDLGATGITLQALDPTGRLVGPSRLLAGTGMAPALIERVSGGTSLGGPLLAWFETAARQPVLKAELLAEDGSEATPPEILNDQSVVGALQGVFTGSLFLVGASDGELHAIALDGASSRPALAAQSWPGPGFAWTGSEGRLVSTSKLVRFDASGAPLGAPVTLPEPPWAPGAIALAGDDSLIAFATQSGAVSTVSTRVRVGRFATDGTTLTEPIDVVVDPTRVAAVKLSSHGSKAVLAWVGGSSTYEGSIGLASLVP